MNYDDDMCSSLCGLKYRMAFFFTLFNFSSKKINSFLLAFSQITKTCCFHIKGLLLVELKLLRVFLLCRSCSSVPRLVHRLSTPLLFFDTGCCIFLVLTGSFSSLLLLLPLVASFSLLFCLASGHDDGWLSPGISNSPC